MRTFDYRALREQNWDSEILGYVAQIHEWKGRQDLFLKQKPTQLKRLVEIAKIQSTEASNKIEGIVTTSTRIKQLCADKTTPRTRDEKEIMGYRDVLNTIHENYEYITLNSAFILQLHRDLYQYSEKSFGGRFKNTQNFISEKSTDGTERVRFMPLSPFETPDAVERICKNFRSALDQDTVDSLILIPIFLLDFLCIHPFNDGNGRMSRLLMTLLLYQCGYEVGRFISLETGIERTKEHFYETLETSSFGWHDAAEDPTPFIKYFLGILLAAYRDFDSRIYLTEKKESSVETVKRAIAGKIGTFTKNDLLELCPEIGKASVENALKTLIENGLIERHGGGRATFYSKKA